METNNFMDSSGNFVKEFFSPANLLPCFSFEFSPGATYIVTTNKIESKKVAYNHRIYFQLHLVVS